jgi:transcriptional regulator with PAS, ATPase and Fis domain
LERPAGGTTEPTSREMARVAADGLYLVAFLREGTRVRRLSVDATVTVGRGAKCDVQVDAMGLSRAHFAIRAGSPPTIRDLESANGTRVRGTKLPSGVDVPLEIGTIIEAGGTFFVLRDHDPHHPLAEEAEPASDAFADAAATRVVVEDPVMAQLHQRIALVARSSMPLIVVGETGVGKEIVATALHARSPRRRKPLVRINCAAVPESLLESELFGFERGAFTGATQAKSGLIESADGSSFFLDEIGEMPLPIQAKLLRVLESGEITRLGALKPRTVDVRFIAATNRNLAALVVERRFRADLYYRLNGMTLAIPPLRERVTEISKLASLFLSAGAERAKRAVPRLSREALALLERHPWPGNVRELRNVMDRALTVCPADVIGEEAILLDPIEARDGGGEPGPAAPTAPTMRPRASAPPRGRLVRRDPATERALIAEALETARGHQGRAAELLGISRRTLINRLDEYGIRRPRKP